MEIIYKTDVKDILTVGDIFKKEDNDVEGIITGFNAECFEYLELTSKTYPGRVASMAYSCYKANGLQVIGNIQSANIVYKYRLGSFIPKIYKSNCCNFAGSIVLTTEGRLAFVVRSEARRDYCELIYLEPLVCSNANKNQIIRFKFSETNFLYRIAGYKDYSLVF